MVSKAYKTLKQYAPLIAVIIAIAVGLIIWDLVEFHQKVFDEHRREIWRLNWEPSIGQLRINGTVYYIVSIGDDPTFATTNITEAFEWANDFIREWGWMWKP